MLRPAQLGRCRRYNHPFFRCSFPELNVLKRTECVTLRPQTAIRAQPTRVQLKRTRAIQSAPRVSLCSDGTYSIVAQVPQREYPKVLCPQVRQRLADLHAVVQRLQLPADPGVSLQHAARTFVSLQHAARTFVSLQHAARMCLHRPRAHALRVQDVGRAVALFAVPVRLACTSGRLPSCTLAGPGASQLHVVSGNRRLARVSRLLARARADNARTAESV